MWTLELKDVANMALRKCKGMYYYFDSEGVYQSLDEKEAVKLLKNVHAREDDSTFFILILPELNILKLQKALSTFPVGANFSQFKNKYWETQLDIRIKPEGLDRFITKIGKPIFGRKPENPKNDTFDYISVDVFVVSQWESDILKYIKANRKEIFKRALAKIEEPIKKYGIPVNFLFISDATYSKRLNLIKLVFELKHG